MKKLIILIVFFSIFFNSCSSNKPVSADTRIGETSNKTEVTRSEPNSVEFNGSLVSGICIKDVNTNVENKYSGINFIKEFCNFIKLQKYTKTDVKWDKAYEVNLLDEEGKPVLNMFFSERAVTFTQDINLGNTVLQKGIYEVDQWISDYLRKMYEGMVLNPGQIKLPARIKIPDNYYYLEMFDNGKDKINQFKTITDLYSFTGKYFNNKEFEIIESRRMMEYELMESEISRIKKEGRSIFITFDTSETFFDISSMNKYKETAKGYVVVLTKQADRQDTYKLITNNMIFLVRVSDEFDNGFEAIFEENARVQKVLTPDEIKSLFKENKPYWMEYVGKNLGIANWYGNPPDRVEKQQLKLDAHSKPYTVLSIYNPYDVRVLVFRENADKTYEFRGFMDFGGRVAGTEYHLEKGKNDIWVVGNRCRGYGTGVHLYYEDWYAVTDKGVKLVLSYPYDEYSEGPDGGYSFIKKGVKVIHGDKTKVSVDYTVTKKYFLDLKIADEQGAVSVAASRKAVFEWNKDKATFESGNPVDEYGVTRFPVAGADVAKQCDNILNKYSRQLLDNVKSISEEKDESTRRWKANSLKAFLDDCPDSGKKREVLGKLLLELKDEFK